MTTLTGIVDSKTKAWKCNGELSVSNETFQSISTSVGPDESLITRTHETGGFKKGLRPYTNHSASGVKYLKFAVGETMVRTQSNICPSDTSTMTSHVESSGSCYLSSMSWVDDLPEIVEDQEVQDGLLTQAFAEATQGIMDISTNVGELPETVAMLANTYRRLKLSVIETLEAYIKRLIRKHGAAWPLYALRDGVAGLENFWLEYRYGWKPLYGSIRDLHRAIEYVDLIGESVYRTGKARKLVANALLSVGPHQVTTTGFTSHEQTLIVQSEYSQINRACATVHLPRVHAAFSNSSVVTAWELLPLSFVIDWFADVGSFLTSLAYGRISTQSTLCTSYEVKQTVKITGHIIETGEFGRHLTHPLEIEAERFNYRRTVASRVSPTIALGGIGELSSVRKIDLLALLHQRIPKIK